MDKKENKVELYLDTYSDRSFVVRGTSTKSYKENLKKLGGKWNSNLKDGEGWIFSIKRKEEVEKFIKETMTGLLPSPSQKKSTEEILQNLLNFSKDAEKRFDDILTILSDIRNKIDEL